MTSSNPYRSTLTQIFAGALAAAVLAFAPSGAFAQHGGLGAIWFALNGEASSAIRACHDFAASRRRVNAHRTDSRYFDRRGNWWNCERRKRAPVTFRRACVFGAWQRIPASWRDRRAAHIGCWLSADGIAPVAIRAGPFRSAELFRPGPPNVAGIAFAQQQQRSDRRAFGIESSGSRRTLAWGDRAPGAAA